MIDLACPHCSSPLSVNDGLAGQNVPCPHCGRAVPVPAPQAQRWYHSRDGKTSHGPVTLPQLQAMASAGTLAPTDVVVREGSTAWQPVTEVVGVPAGRRRRLGLALSGGGMRAAFFHVGVMAQMARLGLLRHLEVISTVSGGSIIGALYYLHVKRLLEETPDALITDEDYQKIIARIERDFFEAVERNLRVRALFNPVPFIRTCLPNY